MRNQYPNSKVLALLILAFSCYECENKPVKADSILESNSDSINYKSKHIEPHELEKPATTSPIFMTFSYGMSDEQFENERTRLISEGLLVKQEPVKSGEGDLEFGIDNVVVLFEPVEGAKFILLPNYFMKDGNPLLNSVQLIDQHTTERLQSKLLAIYKDKYGGKFILTRNVEDIGNIHGHYAGKVISTNYSWQHVDGRKIELALLTLSRDYKPRKDRPEAMANLLTDTGFKKDDWVKIPSIVTRETHVEYFSKEAIKDEKIQKIKEKTKNDEVKLQQYKRIQKNANNI